MTYAAQMALASRYRLPQKLVVRLFRYAGVSAISTSVSMGILAALVASNAVTAGWANVIATACGTVPSFELNRRWVWGKTGRRSLGREMTPFWALSFLGLGLSTLTVRAATAWATSHHFGSGSRALAATAASLVTFGALWVVQYVLLDRVLFQSPPLSNSVDEREDGTLDASWTQERWRRLCSKALAAPHAIPSSASAGSRSASEAGARSYRSSGKTDST
jgi:putative flippase GtrA